MSDGQTPREQIKELAGDLGCKPDHLLMQSRKRDPMYVGTSGQLKKGRWAAELWEQAVSNRAEDDREIHPRGVHYFIVENPITVQSPSERTEWSTYRHTESCYDYLADALIEARKLGMIPLDGIVDQKHDQKTVTKYSEHITVPDRLPYVPTGVNLPSIPEVDATASTRFDRGEIADYVADYLIREYRRQIHFDETSQQPYHIEVWCEKTIPGGDRIRNVLRNLGVNVLVEGEGDLSYGLAGGLASRLRDARKPGVIFYLSDFDPKGHEMAEKMAAKLSWMDVTDQLPERVVLDPLALTLDQVRANDFTRKPIPDSEKHGTGAKAANTLRDEWERRFGEGAVEINIFEHDPAPFADLLEEGISAVLDDDLPLKNRNARDEWEDQLREEIHDVVEDVDDLEDLESELGEWIEGFNDALEEAKEHIARLQDLVSTGGYADWKESLSSAIESADIPSAEVPEGEAPLPTDPLFDSSRPYLENVERVKIHRREEIPWQNDGHGGGL